MTISTPDGPPSIGPEGRDGTPPDNLRKRAIRDIARSALQASATGFDFGDLEPAVRALTALNRFVQSRKAVANGHDDEELARVRRERALQADHVGLALLNAQDRVQLPRIVNDAIERYRTAFEPESSRDGPFRSSDDLIGALDRPHVPIGPQFDQLDRARPDDTPVNVAEEGIGPNIRGLTEIPTFGEPNLNFVIPPPPDTWELRLRNSVDDADVWYQEHRRTVLIVASVPALLLVVLNVALFAYVVSNEDDYIPSEVRASGNQTRETDTLRTDSLSGAPSAANAKMTNLAILSPALLIVALVLIVTVWRRMHIRSHEWAYKFSLRQLKATLVPADVSSRNAAAPIPSLAIVDPQLNVAGPRKLTARERQIRLAQGVGLLLLIAAIVLPPAIHIAAKQWLVHITANESARSLRADEGTEQPADDPASVYERAEINLRRFYTRITALLALMFFIIFMIFVLRRLHVATNRRVGRLGGGAGPPLTKRVDAEPAPWGSPGAIQAASIDAPIDHEDPYGAMNQTDRLSERGRLLLKIFKVEARLVAYQIFNKWRLINFLVALTDNTFRIFGIAAFGILVITSVVMPLLVLNMLHGEDLGNTDALRENAALLFPELANLDSDNSSNTPARQVELRPPQAGGHEEYSSDVGTEWIFWYLIIVACLAAINFALLLVRLLQRKSSTHNVAGSSWRLSIEAASAALVILVALGVAGWLSANSVVNQHAKALGTREDERPKPWHRKPKDPQRMYVLTTEKLLSELAHPELTFTHVWYVDMKSKGPVRDGRSWDTAFHTVQQAVQSARSEGGGEIWVGTGWYRVNAETGRSKRAPQTLAQSPDVELPKSQTISNGESEAACFVIAPGVFLYGGFRGATPRGYEQSRMERDWKRFPVVIDLSSTSPARLCLQIVPSTGNWRFDGFVLLGGRALRAGKPVSLGANPYYGRAILQTANSIHISPFSTVEAQS